MIRHDLIINHLINGKGRMLVVSPYKFDFSIVDKVIEQIPECQVSRVGGEIRYKDNVVTFMREPLSACKIKGYQFTSVIIDELCSVDQEELVSRIVVPRS